MAGPLKKIFVLAASLSILKILIVNSSTGFNGRGYNVIILHLIFFLRNTYTQLN